MCDDIAIAGLDGFSRLRRLMALGVRRRAGDDIIDVDLSETTRSTLVSIAGFGRIQQSGFMK